MTSFGFLGLWLLVSSRRRPPLSDLRPACRSPARSAQPSLLRPVLRGPRSRRPAARDFRCGTLSYDGHNGTDFRVPTLAAQKRRRRRARGCPWAVCCGCATACRTSPSGSWDGERVQGSRMRQRPWSSPMRAASETPVLPHGARQRGREAGRNRRRPGSRSDGSACRAWPSSRIFTSSLRRNGRIVDPFAPEAAGSCGAARPPRSGTKPPRRALAYARRLRAQRGLLARRP